MTTDPQTRTTQQPTADLVVRPFVVDVSDADLAELHTRLDRTRFAPAAPDDDWRYGTPVDYLRHAVRAWRELDWRAVERRINAVPHFLTEIDGQRLHFIHVKSPHPGATPLLLAHTYPGSSLDYLDLIGRLVDPVAHGGRAEDAFDVVAPDAPGSGWSTPVHEAGWTTARIARTYDTLMRGLGYTGYGVHGSDHGAMVARELGILEPDGFLGLHVLQLFSFPSGDPSEFERLEPGDHEGLEHMAWFQSVGGYNAMNASRPQTIGAALSDSPVGLLAYSELFESFGNGTSRVPLDAILRQVSVTWFANAAATMARMYYDDARVGSQPQVNHARTGVSVFAHDFRTVKVFAERDNDNITSWVHHDRGGHYAALEVPEVVAADLAAFFATGRNS